MQLSARDLNIVDGCFLRRLPVFFTEVILSFLKERWRRRDLLEDDLWFISKCHFENPENIQGASHKNNMKGRLKMGPLVE